MSLRPYLARHWPALAGAGASTVVLTLAQLAQPWPLKLVIDHLVAGSAGRFRLAGSAGGFLVAVAALVLGIALVGAIASYCADFWLNRAGEQIVHDLRISAYAHLQRLSLAFHDHRRTGDLVTRITGDVNAVGTLFAESLGELTSAVLLLVGMAVVTFLLDPQLALAVFAVTPVLGLTTFHYRRRIKSLARRQRSEEGEIASLATEALAAMQVVKAFGSERFEYDRVEDRSVARRELGIHAARAEARFSGLIDVLGAVATAFVLVFGVVRVVTGALTPGELVVFVSYASKTYKPLRDIARQATKIARSLARGDRVAELLATDSALEDRRGAHAVGRARGDIELDGVWFSYEADRPALRGLSLRVPAGARVAIVGRSGAGKSTVGALLARFYDPSAGRVLIDGRDARDCTLDWLRRQVGLLLQETVLFSGTVAENIAYATDASRSEIVAAAETAGAHEFISELPNGYDTELGPRGIGLSGGQRQRIGIARVLLRDPPILVLDEPTTGLDAASEAELLRGLEVLMRGRTTLLVTHSLDLARGADRVVVVEDGRVVEDGPPAELVARRGSFSELVAARRAPVRRTRARTPRDERLPQLAALLDPDRVAPVLRGSLRPGDSLDDLRPTHVRYRRGRTAAVHYEALVSGQVAQAVVVADRKRDLAAEARSPASAAIAAHVGDRAPAARPVFYDAGLGALVQWLPVDLALPGLALAPEEVAARLGAEGIATGPLARQSPLLRYKPLARAVVRLDGHVLKAYADERAFAKALVGLRAASAAESVQAPRFETTFPEVRVTVQAAVEGRLPEDLATAREAGELLRLVHRLPTAGLPAVPAQRALAAARAGAEALTILVPHLGARAVAAVDRLEQTAPPDGTLVAAHGDFDAGQLLVGADGLTLVDFDDLCTAPPALDLGGYAAHLVRGERGDVELALAALDRLVEGYGEAPPGLHWYLAATVLRRLAAPFRVLDERWPERVEGMLGAAEEVLAA